MILPILPKEVAESVDYILEYCNGNINAFLEEMINTLPATPQGLKIRKFTKENWDLLIQALVYGYSVSP